MSEGRHRRQGGFRIAPYRHVLTALGSLLIVALVAAGASSTAVVMPTTVIARPTQFSAHLDFTPVATPPPTTVDAPPLPSLTAPSPTPTPGGTSVHASGSLLVDTAATLRFRNAKTH